LAEHGGSEIERIVKILSDMEMKLDEVKAGIGQKKRELREIMREEVEKAKDEVLKDASGLLQKALDEAKSSAEDEVAKILAKSDGEIKELKDKIEKKFEDALELVLKSIMGG